jgi:membrane protein DedA with SNARE-associated domain/rhodanese-related sulfurtransferase
MTEASRFLTHYGAATLFAAVFLEQMGLPLPVVPLLLAAGALSSTGQFNLLTGFGLTVLACLIADTLWFYLGRYRGHRVLGLLCRISLEPDSCVRRTQNVFTRHGLRGVVVAKFVPGLSTVAPPLAGMAGVGIGRFLLADGLGAVLYGGGFLFLGYLFSSQIQQLAAALGSVGGGLLRLVIGLGVIYVGFKYWQRQRILRELRMARITVAELRQKQAAGEPLVILDLRSGAELERDPSLIPGAIRFRVEDIEHRHHEIPRDREVVAYCSCPNEVSSARVALLLRRKGVTRVRPLLGGIDAWRDLDYPLQSATTTITLPAQANQPAELSIARDGTSNQHAA